MNAQQLRDLRAKNLGIKPSLIGREFPTELGGVAEITAYSKSHDAYRTTTGLWWKLEDGKLISYNELSSDENGDENNDTN